MVQCLIADGLKPCLPFLPFFGFNRIAAIKFAVESAEKVNNSVVCMHT